MADKPDDKSDKEPFVSQADRPEVRLKSDTPVSDLTVRDLVTILGQLGTGKDFWDGKDWQKDDFDGQIKPWKDGKELLKEVKDKDKDVKEKDKETKETKEKREIKELKAEKVEKPEFDGVFARSARDDPRIEQIIRALAGMSTKVDQLTDQLEALRKERG
jgi:hypothetical protein